MKIKSTFAWGMLMLASAMGGAVIGDGVVTWYDGHDGTYGAYAGPVGAEYDASTLSPQLRIWACPETGPDVVSEMLGCPVDMSPAYIRRAYQTAPVSGGPYRTEGGS